LPTAAAVAAAVVTTAVVGAGLTAGHGVRREERSVVDPAAVSTAGSAAVPTPAPTAAQARAVLRVWDRRRAAAWEHGDLTALSGLYVSGSTTGRRDVAMLAAYRRRGLRVTGMTRQVLRLRVTASTPRQLRLVVTDRLVDARVVGPALRAAVPDGRLATRRVSLARAGHRWQVTEVRAGQPAR
jgi:hypothetical protein